MLVRSGVIIITLPRVTNVVIAMNFGLSTDNASQCHMYMVLFD